MKTILPVILFFALYANSLSAAEKLLLSPQEYAKQHYEVQDRVTKSLNASTRLQRLQLLDGARRLSRIQNPEDKNKQRDVNVDDIADLSNYFNKDMFQTVSPDVPYHLIDTTEAAQKEADTFRQKQLMQRSISQPKPKPVAPNPASKNTSPKTFRRTFSR